MIKLSIATAHTAGARSWKNRTITWPEFVERLKQPKRTGETYAEYVAMTKPEQGRIKDAGGYVCGYLNGGRRTKSAVMCRSALTLDLDFAPLDFWLIFTLQLGCAAVLHSTHKHSSSTPRFRLVIPLDREVTPDEYVAVARKVASWLRIDYFDPTTFDVNRLMFWPTVARDGEWVFEEQAGEPLCADEVLSAYRDWRDVSEWAFASSVAERIAAERGRKQQDPTTKNNIVGYFCQAYDIHQAIEEFLPEVYEPAGEGRYTYLQGSTAAGLVTYDDLFAYSHHGTDPASGELCNAFDLVRIHKFGHLDGDSAPDAKTTGKKSYKAMTEFCQGLKPVKRVIAQNITRDFEEYSEAEGAEPSAPVGSAPVKATAAGELPNGDDWRDALDVNKTGGYESTARNATLILRNDPHLSGRVCADLFSGRELVTAPLPWHKDKDKDKDEALYPRPLCDLDYAGLRNYIERVYNISSPQKIDDALMLELERNSFHPVREWLYSLRWDGVPRIETLLVECFDAEDNLYTREVSRKWMVAAVARVMDPGCKYDTVITLVGEEGTRKSSFFRKLGGRWFSDSLTTVAGKEAFEQIAGRWIVEVAELSAMSKAESELIKYFLSKQTDTYRPAYGRKVVEYKRQCVFAATSNNRTFLRDQDGNRRFWPIDVRLDAKTGGRLDPMSDEFDALIPLLWAEAVSMWRAGEPLILSNAAERIADEVRMNHVESDARRGMVEAFLDTEVPAGWDDQGLEFRRTWLADPEGFRTGGKTFRRSRVCLAEIWCECFGKRREDLTPKESRALAGIMRSLPGWTLRPTTTRFKPYGPQKYYERTTL